jgi:hypothetical protein
MLKMAKGEEALELSDDPRSIRDIAKHNRLRVMIEEEAIKPTWGCPLYIAARKGGWLTEDQKRAGDKYQQVCIDYADSQQIDPDRLMPEVRELAYRRIAHRKALWKECVSTLGLGRKLVDSFVLREESVTHQAGRLVVRDGLQLLSNFFEAGTKRERK